MAVGVFGIRANGRCGRWFLMSSRPALTYSSSEFLGRSLPVVIAIWRLPASLGPRKQASASLKPCPADNTGHGVLLDGFFREV